MSGSGRVSVSVPEGYVLTKKTDLQSLQNLVKTISSFNNNRDRENAINDIISSSSRGYAIREKEDLIAKFDSACKNSRLKSKIEDVKSDCTKTLKKNMKDIQKRQNDSKKALKKNFEAGASVLKECYESELLKSFQNKTSLNNSLPVEQYACEELVKTYRECLKRQLLPEMEKMYKTHCHKMEGAMKEWVSQYNTVALKDTHKVSPAISERMNNIQRRLDQLTQNAQNGSTVERKIDQTLQRITQDIGQLTVEVREVAPSHEQIVAECLGRQDFQQALNNALVAMDLELLMSTCNKMSVDDVFGDVLPEQPILLALLNQLPYNLQQDLEIKSSYLVETVLALDLADQVIASNSETVFRELTKLIEHIDSTRSQITPRQYNQHLKQLRWSTEQIIRQLDQY
ncbi:probable E3 ubiquitin-protein ligase bre1 [Bolinopsis microptera]|uniref:probable E3 ubiquitin-protein ligase bre1 n=1 Tax=Bolinopsis microptera TaxID=2820187 RepID=UPI00307B0266